MKTKIAGTYIVNIILVLFLAANGHAQEHIAPLRYNPNVKPAKSTAGQSRTTSITLPFFDDFTNYDVIPDQSKWVDRQVYVNNTMCIQPISRGVATFDVLSERGYPYDTTDNYAVHFCDSLTSQPIDLSSYTAVDSLYLSFFYQPGGNGFAPLSSDSLMVFMRKKNSDWIKVWSVTGTNSQPFRCVMLPITDTDYLYADFQFRFMNFGATQFSDAVWNVDYVKLAANRNLYDTLVNDVAYTSDPTFMLNDYTFMPYRQFLANTNAELASQLSDTIRNNYQSGQSVTFGYVATETVSGTPLFTSATGTANLIPHLPQAVSFPTYTTTTPLVDPFARVVFENKFYLQTGASDPRQNDTAVRQQVFDNYLAYDDGTAELSYYLSQFYSLPAKLAIQFHLNQADTLQGLAIYFGRQVPLGTGKNFSIAVYSDLAGINGAASDHILHQEDDFFPGYDSVNHFWVYKLGQPVSLPAGTFYISTIQPAFGVSDSLYFGLDANRQATNHAYYNVQAQWFQSQIPGAIMIRPLLGQPVIGTAVHEVKPNYTFTVTPNPVSDNMHISYSGITAPVYIISDMEGRNVMSGSLSRTSDINVGSLTPGIYFVRLRSNGILTPPQKIVKQ